MWWLFQERYDWREQRWDWVGKWCIEDCWDVMPAAMPWQMAHGPLNTLC